VEAEGVHDCPSGQSDQPELIPISEQRVRVRLPRDKGAGKVQLLVSGKPVRAEESGGYLVVTVPTILAHEVVAIDLTSK
jgi:hypothetical protein